ncbi:MAG: LamG domain-containing protein [Candidatus Micrarchaeaceae archaeon]
MRNSRKEQKGNGKAVHFLNPRAAQRLKRRKTSFMLLLTLFSIIIVALILLCAIYILNSGNIGSYFNGSSYVLINNTVNGNFSALLWADYASQNSIGVLLSSGVGENEHSAWYIGDGGELLNKTACGIFSNQKTYGNFTAGWRFAAIPQLEPGHWYQIACVYNSSSVSLFVNGTMVARTNTNYTIEHANIIEIGKRTSTFYLNGTVPTYAYYKGYIENIQVYARALSQKEISRLYKEGPAGKPLENVSIYVPLAGVKTNKGALVPYFLRGIELEGSVEYAKP